MRPRLLVAYTLFALLLVVFFLAVHSEAAKDHVIRPFAEWLARTGAWVIGLFGTKVWTYGTQINTRHFSIDIHKGCDGIESLCILWAAVLAYPWPEWGLLRGLGGSGGGKLRALSPIWTRLLGLVAGGVILQGANILRIISLFYIGRNWPWLFDQSHVLIWQSLIILVALVIWYAWVVLVADARR